MTFTVAENILLNKILSKSNSRSYKWKNIEREWDKECKKKIISIKNYYTTVDKSQS